MEIAATKIQKVFRRWRLLRLYILSWSNELQNQVSEICFHLNSSNKPCETLIANEEDTTSLPELEIMERDMRMNKSISILENVLEKIVFVVNTFVNTPYSKTKNKIPLLIVLRDLYQAQMLIRSVLQSIGGISVKMILEIHLGEDATEYALINSKWVSIMNSKFKPSSYKLFVYDGTKEFLPIESIDNRSTKTSGGGGSGQEIRTLIPSMFSFAKSSSISAEDSLVCDIKHLGMLKSSSKKILAVEDQQHVTRIYLHIPSTKEQNNTSPFYLRLSGTFYYEYFQNFRVLSLPCMTSKFGELQQMLLNSSKLPASYVDKWLKTVTFSDLLCLSTQKLQSRCISLYNLIEKYKSCLVSNIIKEFLSADVSTKRDILTSLYLVDDNSDMLYIGFMLADIVRSDPSYLRQKAQMTDVISTLPWSIRKKINKSVENREIMQTRIINEISSVSGTDAEISYETRIFLMKVPQF
jgi:hypothetical protein